MQVFLTSHKPLTPDREYFEKLTVDSLLLNGHRPIIIRKKMLERYFEAERLATSDFYVVCDNDIILKKPDTLKRMLEIIKKYPELGQLGCGWGNMQNEEGSSWKLGVIGDDVWEFYGCGGCIIFRRGILKDLGIKMEFENYGDDRVIGETFRKLGYKVGIAHKLEMIHLGMGNEYTTFKQTNIT